MCIRDREAERLTEVDMSVARAIGAVERVALALEVSSRARRAERELARDLKPRDRKCFEIDKRRRTVVECLGRVVIERRVAINTEHTELPVHQTYL